MDDPRNQPALPFDPALELVRSDDATAPPREVSFDAFTSLLFEEFARRTAAVRERDARWNPISHNQPDLTSRNPT